MLLTLCQYFMTFVLYSFAGWVLETLLYMFKQKQVVKRGFLFGPVCPIYGCGAVICTATLYGKVNNIFLVFIIALLLCGSLEYLTHFIMEKMFHAMWWDYSSRRFNIKGRVYLKGLFAFGLAGVLIVKITQPLVYKFLELFDDNTIYTVSFIIYTILIIDLTATVTDLNSIVSSVKKIQNLMITGTQKGFDTTREQAQELRNKIKENEVVAKYINSLKNDNKLVNRFKNIVPNAKFKKYQYIWELILDKPQEGAGRTDIKLYGTIDSIPEAEEETENKNSDI